MDSLAPTDPVNIEGDPEGVLKALLDTETDAGPEDVVEPVLDE